IVEPFAFGISKGGIGKESHTRLMTHAASSGRSTFGNVRELFRTGALIHRGVGHENGVRLSYKNVEAAGVLSFLWPNPLLALSARMRIVSSEERRVRQEWA